MTRTIRALLGLVATLAFVFTLAGGGGTASSVNAAKPTPTPTPGSDPDAAPDPGRAAGRPPRLELRHRAVPLPDLVGDSTQSMAARFPSSAPEQLAVVVEVAGGSGRNGCWAHFPQPATGPGRTSPGTTSICSSRRSTRSTPPASRSGSRSSRPSATCRCSSTSCTCSTATIRASSASAWTTSGTARTSFATASRSRTPKRQAWVAKVRSYHAEDLVLVKHWLPEKMPPTYRDGLVFVDDSQGLGSLSAMVSEFSVWGQTFAPVAGRLPVRLFDRQELVGHHGRSAARHRQCPDLGHPQHARPPLGRLHRLRHLAGRVGLAAHIPRPGRRWGPAGSLLLGMGVAPAVGLEPTTKRLTAARSTTELRRNVSRASRPRGRVARGRSEGYLRQRGEQRREHGRRQRRIGLGTAQGASIGLSGRLPHSSHDPA